MNLDLTLCHFGREVYPETERHFWKFSYRVLRIRLASNSAVAQRKIPDRYFWQGFASDNSGLNWTHKLSGLLSARQIPTWYWDANFTTVLSGWPKEMMGKPAAR
jgi:hypothetical protein